MDDLIALGRTLCNHAEPGFFETETHRILVERFQDLDFSVQEFAGIPGFIANGDGKTDNKTIALLADMDGLPTGQDGGYQHSCGHHLQMTALYGTARIMQENAPELNFIPDWAMVESCVRAVDGQTVREIADKLCGAAQGCAADPELHDLLGSTAPISGSWTSGRPMCFLLSS